MERPSKKRTLSGETNRTPLTLGFLLMFSATGACREPVASRAPVVPAAAPRALANLTAFARLFGVVRHFHPSDEGVSANWERLAVAGVSRVERARTGAELAERLQEIFTPVAPSVRVFVTRKNGPPPAGREGPKGTQVVSWQHRGLDVGFGEGVYESKRVRRRIADPPAEAAASTPERPLQLALGDGVTATIPLAVYADDLHTMPRAERTPLPPEGTAGSPAAARNERIAAVIVAWNVYQHFYPYFDEVGGSWAEALEEGLTAAIPEHPRDTMTILSHLLARLRDGHAEAIMPGKSGFPDRPPITWVWIDDRLIVTVVEPGGEALQPGDEVLKIDGRPVAVVAAEQEGLISAATRERLRWRALPYLAAGPAHGTVSLEVTGEKGRRTVTLARTARMLPFETERRPPPVAELRPRIHYVDLTRMDDKAFQSALPTLIQARGIVFDLRGYPAVSDKALAHLVGRKIRSPLWLTPIITRPDRQGWTFDRTQWDLEPRDPKLPGPFVFLTDARAVSWAETLLAMVADADLGKIIGQATAGTNGNMNSFFVPGDYLLSFTGMKALSPDGRRHHGVGVVPDLVVQPTRAGVAAGRDEVLDRALTILEPGR